MMERYGWYGIDEGAYIETRHRVEGGEGGKAWREGGEGKEGRGGERRRGRGRTLKSIGARGRSINCRSYSAFPTNRPRNRKNVSWVTLSSFSMTGNDLPVKGL